MATSNDTTAMRDNLAELGCMLDDVKTVLDLMTDIEHGDDPEAKRLHCAALTAFRLVCGAMEKLEEVEAAA